MPKVRPLTRAEREKQADEEAIQRFCEDFMEELRVACARKNMEWQDFEKVIGVSHSTMTLWKGGKLSSSSLGMVLRAARRVGIPVLVSTGIA